MILDDFATVTPEDLEKGSARGQALVGGTWIDGGGGRQIVDPLTGRPFLTVPALEPEAFAPFHEALASCPRSGLHNPFKNVTRYKMLAEVSFKAAHALATPEIADYFARMIQAVMPKSYAQCMGEVRVTQKFLENFSGDRVRFLAESTASPGDHAGQECRQYRFPYGGCVLIAPFNFPLEIPALQTMGALFMGNRLTAKVDSKVSIVYEQFIRLLHACGLPREDLDLIYCRGERMGTFVEQARDAIRMLQFTGSSRVAKRLASLLEGRVLFEDSGFDWKIVGPGYQPSWLKYVAWQSDQDAFAASGQKCSAQSLLFVHDDWYDALIPEIRALAERRRLEDLTIGPVITWTTERMLAHVEKLAAIPGAKVLHGGKPLEGHTIPEVYGAIEPTSVFVPLEAILDPENFATVTTELFGPVEVVTRYRTDQIDLVLQCCERVSNHLTAAIVSNDLHFVHQVLGATVNGTTYWGMRARTTGAPQNHIFAPGGMPQAAIIGTPDGIQDTWSFKRGAIQDVGPLPTSWRVPDAT